MYIYAWTLVAMTATHAGIQPVAFQQTYKTQAECVAAADQMRAQEPKAPPLACLPKARTK